MAKEVPVPRCPLCRSTHRGNSLRKAGYVYASCAACGSAALDPQPSDESLSRIYAQQYFDGGGEVGGYDNYERDEPLHRQNAKRRLAALCADRSAKPGRVLDVGCAHGYFLDEARRAGWAVVGVEPSRTAADSARARLGVPIYENLSAAADHEQKSFDVVCFFQVLEHLRSPEQALRDARTCLKPGGRICIETWDNSSLVARVMGARWQQVSPPTVIHLFSRNGLADVLMKNGFSAPAISVGSKRVSLGFVAGLLAGKGVPGARAVHAIVERARLSHRGVPYRLGDLINVTARAL